jgi:hypothetical protein
LTTMTVPGRASGASRAARKAWASPDPLPAEPAQMASRLAWRRPSGPRIAVSAASAC